MIKGKRCKLGAIKILGDGEIKLGDDVIIEDGTTIDVTERLEIGDRSRIGPNFEIVGKEISIGKEFWSGRYCGIGGGSAKEKQSKLTWGDFGHLGDFAFINTTREVKIGHEVGLGQDSKIYTHGAYLNWFNGFPVQFGSVTIGDNVWIPKAVILPNVFIGNNVIIGAGAVVTKTIPSNCLAVGIPAKPVVGATYPKIYTKDEFNQLVKKFVKHFIDDILEGTDKSRINLIGTRVFIDETLFDLGEKRIDGKVTNITEKFKNELRRYGFRFRYYADESGVYRSW